MKYSIIVCLLTAIELGVTLASYGLHSELVFYNVVVYASPFYMMQHAFGSDSMFYEKSPIYWFFLIFHLVKYFLFFQAQTREERNFCRTMALLFESAYLAISAYYLL